MITSDKHFKINIMEIKDYTDIVFLINQQLFRVFKPSKAEGYYKLLDLKRNEIVRHLYTEDNFEKYLAKGSWKIHQQPNQLIENYPIF